ncbi:inositol monophosphatase family protein [Microbacterium yannicii]|uniref:Inositol monophosphatase family protein n=1 Tax=Microbacterium yannicii TaxID=671622 RepID=A0ABP9LVP2_9MICO|nr:inositol monophosphatase family protein [Microbacterium yannicii]MCO5953606.1 inositol monophosphatase family protein [Microbacterium yannicii]
MVHPRATAADPVADAEVAVRAASAGAAVARARYNTGSRRTADRGLDFTTEADVETERTIRDVLAELRPGDAIVGEELGSSGDGRRRWLVDPICGTLNFAAGIPLFAVNVALDVDDMTTAAAVADPAAGEVFWTDGHAAWHRAATTATEAGADRRLEPSSSSRLVTVNLESSYPDDSGTRVLSDELFRARFSPRILSTTLALAWVATGQQAGYLTGGDLQGSVHWTAGIALCRAAGAVVTNLAGDELHTGDHGLIAAADAETHAFLLDRLHASR